MKKLFTTLALASIAVAQTFNANAQDATNKSPLIDMVKKYIQHTDKKSDLEIVNFGSGSKTHMRIKGGNIDTTKAPTPLTREYLVEFAGESDKGNILNDKNTRLISIFYSNGKTYFIQKEKDGFHLEEYWQGNEQGQSNEFFKSGSMEKCFKKIDETYRTGQSYRL